MYKYVSHFCTHLYTLRLLWTELLEKISILLRFYMYFHEVLRAANTFILTILQDEIVVHIVIKYPWISKLLHNPTYNSFIGGFLQILDYHLLDVNGFNLDFWHWKWKPEILWTKRCFYTPPQLPNLNPVQLVLKKRIPALTDKFIFMHQNLQLIYYLTFNPFISRMWSPAFSPAWKAAPP